MKQRLSRMILASSRGEIAEQQDLFALFNLGLVQSLASGDVTPTEALRLLYNAENCLYVQKHFPEKAAHKIMGHGVQLPDLFDILPAEQAQREFHQELETIRSLSLRILRKSSRMRRKSLAEILAEQRDLPLDWIEEALEDVALVRAIEESESTQSIDREEVYHLLEGQA
jgi:hypothetical protein